MSPDNYDSYITEDDVWSQVIADKSATEGHPVLFLDRDGAIVEEVNYLHRPEDIDFIPGAIEVIRKANQLEIPVVIVTNQAGIGRQYYNWSHFIEVQKKILTVLFDEGASIDGVFACPHHIDARAPYFHKDHPWRKPNPGMLLAAQDQMGVDLGGSWIAGDRAGDVRAGLNAGCAGGVHLQTGHGIREMELEASLALDSSDFQVMSLDSIADLLTELPLFKKRVH
ncbi:MAG: HAD-IIIA family hydrolase [Rhodospirillaceae bacterium]|jgi:D-glycero-D-manno-heptose 1,7-bisphosphate phosphatase|nr:HAD-IIIA family hydrolase [Rhodospirillaceae bacterium]